MSLKVCGVHIDGGMVEYLQVPSSSLIHGNGLSYDELALVEPLAIGVDERDLRDGHLADLGGQLRLVTDRSVHHDGRASIDGSGTVCPRGRRPTRWQIA